MKRVLITGLCLMAASACSPVVVSPAATTMQTRAELGDKAETLPEPKKPSVYDNVTFNDVCQDVPGAEGPLCTMSFHNKENVGFTVQNKSRYVITATVIVENDGAANIKSVAHTADARKTMVGDKEGFSFTVHPGSSKYLIGGLQMIYDKVKDKGYQHTFKFQDIKLGIRYPDSHPEMIKLFGPK